MQNNKMFPVVIGALVILVAGLIFFSGNKESAEVDTGVDTESVGTSMPVPANYEDGVAPVEEMVVEINSFTLVEVATHKVEADCWTAINGEVYDLGAWVKKHPGGDKAILSLCGIDGSAAFNAQHGGQEKQLSVLAGFKIGNLK